MADGPSGAPDDLLAALRRALVDRHEAVRSQFDRSLPSGELLGDRWERAARLGFGAGASIYDSAVVLGDVTVGEQSWIGPASLLDGSGGPLRIGAWCSVSAGVHLYTHDTVAWSLTLGKAPINRAPLTIGDGCHLGAHSIVVAGVTIGDRCVVGANSFVNRDLPSFAVAVGSPAQVVGRVDVDGAEVTLRYGADAVASLGPERLSERPSEG